MKSVNKHWFIAGISLFGFTTLNAQTKIGSNPVTITATTNLEVESTDGTKTDIKSNNGYLGIGTNAPSALLHISGTGGTVMGKFTSTAASDRFILGTSNSAANGSSIDLRGHGTTYTETLFGNSMSGTSSLISFNYLSAPFIMGSYSTSDLVLGTNNTERMRLSSTGYLGIGTTAPTNPLHVVAASNPVRFQGLQSVSGGIDSVLVTDPSTGVFKYANKKLISSGSEPWYNVATGTGADANTQNIYQMSSKLGIGTAAPSQALDIVTQGGSGADNIHLTAYGTNSSPSLRFQAAQGTLASPSFVANGQVPGALLSAAWNGSGFTDVASMRSYATETHTSSSLGTNIVFHTTANGTTSITERMRIENNGYTGIGTASPTAPLHVNSASSPAVRIVDGTQATNYVLTSDANGNGSWKAQVINVVTGTLPATGPTITTDNVYTYTNGYITLPAGKWIVHLGSTGQMSGMNITDAQYWLGLFLCDGNSSFAITGDIISGVSGIEIRGPIGRGMSLCFINGALAINNTTGANKTYYIWALKAPIGGTPTSLSWINVTGNTNLERYLYAIKTN